MKDTNSDQVSAGAGELRYQSKGSMKDAQSK